MENSRALGDCVYSSGVGHELIPLTSFFPLCGPVHSFIVVDTMFQDTVSEWEGLFSVVDTMFQGTLSQSVRVHSM